MKVFLDNAATTKILPKVLQKIVEVENDFYANSASVHSMGVEATKHIEKSRILIAKKLNVESDNIFFTSGGTESNNWALKSIAENCNDISKKKNIIISAFEHPSVEEVSKWISQKYNLNIDYIEVDSDGIIILQDFERKISKETLYCSIMHVNNEIGTIQPIDKITKICKNLNVPFHVDACQSFLKIPFDFTTSSVDLLTINSHKTHGPKGVGALIVNNKIKLPLFHGGGHELGLRSGTLNTAGIAGFGQAVSEVDQNKLQEISDYLFKKLSCINNIQFNSKKENRVPHIINFRIDGISAKDIFWYLNSKNIFISTSSACASNKNTPSQTLKAIGLTEKQNFESVRVSLSCLTTKDEVDYLINSLIEFRGNN